jgi:hypothetical protein
MNDVADSTLETNVLPDLPFEQETPPAGGEHEVVDPAVAKPPPTDDLRDAMTELAETVRQIATPPKPTTPPPTPEEIAEFWKVYDPESSDKEFFKKWFRLNPEATVEEVQAVKELFAGVQKGLMRQSVTATQNYIKMMRDEIDRDYGPLREYVEEQKREATRGRFYGAYPALDETKYQKIIDATARALDNQTFADEGAYFKALAEGAADSIKAILPDFDIGARPTTKTPGKTPKLPRTSAGGGGGAGKGAGSGLEPTGKRNDIDSLDDETD